MTTKIGIGFSRDSDIMKAAKDAAAQSRSQLPYKEISIAIVFSTVQYHPKVILPVIIETLESNRIIGCSTAGVILPQSVETHGISVISIFSDEITFGLGSINNIDTQNIQNAGISLAQESLKDFGTSRRQIFLFLIDHHIQNIAPFIKGSQEILGNAFSIVGAGSSDDFRFSETFQFCKGNVFTKSAVGLIIGGHSTVGIGSSHGWRPLGKPRLVDHSEGNIIKTIDGKVAADIYREFLGDDIDELQSTQRGKMTILYPLGILSKGNENYILRNAVDILPNGNIVCQGDVPEGSTIHMMLGNKETCKSATVDAAKEARKNLLEKEVKLVIIIESMARLKLFGRNAFKEIVKIKDIFGNNVPIIGMYSNGEVCPFQSTENIKKPLHQNESILILAIS